MAKGVGVFTTAFLVSVCSVIPLSAQAQSGKPQSWTCSASGLQASEYKGGNAAYIHLVGYETGGYYPVEKKGNVATGVTANGTKFSCRAS